MDINNIGTSLLRNYNNEYLKKSQVNAINNKEDKNVSLKEVGSLNKGKHLAEERLNSTYKSSTNKKIQEYLERKLSTLNEKKGIIENKDRKNDELESKKADKDIKSIETNEKKETQLSKEEQLSIQDINKEIAKTGARLQEMRISGEELNQESEMIDEKISVFKKVYGSDIFKKAEKEAVLKQTYEISNNPLIKELKSTLNEIVEIEMQLKENLNRNQLEDKPQDKIENELDN